VGMIAGLRVMKGHEVVIDAPLDSTRSAFVSASFSSGAGDARAGPPGPDQRGRPRAADQHRGIR